MEKLRKNCVSAANPEIVTNRHRRDPNSEGWQQSAEFPTDEVGTLWWRSYSRTSWPRRVSEKTEDVWLPDGKRLPSRSVWSKRTSQKSDG